MLKNKSYAGFFLVVAAMVPFCIFGAQIVGGWTINTDASGGVTSLSLTSPRTFLNIEQTVDILVDYQGTPIRGTVKFRNGLQKDLNYPEEVNFFWDEFKGAHAIWEYLASMNRVELFNPDDATIPQMMYGRNARVITKAGTEYFGKLIEHQGNPDWFNMDIQGSPLLLYRHSIAVIQLLR
jgi:hypothetical protein